MKLKNISMSSSFIFQLLDLVVFITKFIFRKLDVENCNFVSKLFKAININIEIDNVDSTLFNVVDLNVGVHSVASTLI